MASILWAEDGLDDQYLIKHALGQLPLAPKVEFVEDGEAVLGALGAGHPDLVVLDLNMPVLDGVATLRRLKAADGTKAIPVVVFSTGREETAVQTCKRLGVVDYIQKPFHYNDFTTAVARICEFAKPGSGARAKKGKP
ncbi:MAG TPA: response regulator [Candidatus Thermoplasmatota archaeon]|nr:response regulator [Candidatus Thermoplasmatota archaeon]